MASENTLLTLAVIAVLVSGAAMLIGWNVYDSSKIRLSPNETGNVTITVSQNLDISVTPATINWGAGAPDSGVQYAELHTGAGAAAGQVINGTGWAVVNDGFTITNIGNVDAQIFVAAQNNSSEFICLNNAPCIASGIAVFNYSVTNNEAASCSPFSPGFTQGTWYAVNRTSSPFINKGTSVCDDFNAEDGTDTIWLDVLLRVPGTGTPTGARQTTLYVSAQISSTP